MKLSEARVDEIPSIIENHIKLLDFACYKILQMHMYEYANHLIMTALIESESLGVLIHRFDLRLDALGENVYCSISQNLSHATASVTLSLYPSLR